MDVSDMMMPGEPMLMPTSPSAPPAAAAQAVVRGRSPPASRPPVARPTNPARGGYAGGRGGKGPRPGARDDEGLHRAASLFQCSLQFVYGFYDLVDPLNPCNRVSGFMCKQEGPHKGSLILTAVNGQPLVKPHLVYGTPRMQLPYKKAEAATEDDGDDTVVLDISTEYDTFPECHSYYLATKWNGINVIFFTYRDLMNHTFVSATTRGRVFLDDSAFGHVRSGVYRVIARWLGKREHEMTLPFPLAASERSASSSDSPTGEAKAEAEGPEAGRPRGYGGGGGGAAWRQPRAQAVPMIEFAALPPALALLRDEDNVQSVSFELCGADEPHLIAYPFALDLKPLFVTSPTGVISPIIPAKPTRPTLARELIAQSEEAKKASADASEDAAAAAAAAVVSDDEAEEALLRQTERLLPFTGSQDLQGVCKDLQRWGEKQNKAWRKLKNVTQALFFHHFVVEGWVLYLLNAQGQAIDRRSAMYKIKPKDVEGSHHERFDLGVQKMVLLGLEKCYLAGKAPTPANLRDELEWPTRAWKRFEQEIHPLLDGRPNPEALLQAQEEERQKNGGQVQRMVIMMGVPGSGKSTLAKRLMAAYPEFVRVNQDEMKTRKRCEFEAEAGLRRGKSILVDRCNFDYQQRLTWIKLARKYGVNAIEVVWLKVSLEVCKQRVSVRTDHPTIAPGEQGLAIIDRFKSMLAEPLPAEGLTAIHILESDEDTLRVFPALAAAT